MIGDVNGRRGVLSVAVLALLVAAEPSNGRINNIKIGYKVGGDDIKSGSFLEINHLWDIAPGVSIGPSIGAGMSNGAGKIAKAYQIILVPIQVKIRRTIPAGRAKFYVEAGTGYFYSSNSIRGVNVTLGTASIRDINIDGTIGFDLGIGCDFKIGESFHLGLGLNRQFVSPAASIKYSDGSQQKQSVDIGSMLIGLNLTWIF